MDDGFGVEGWVCNEGWEADGIAYEGCVDKQLDWFLDEVGPWGNVDVCWTGTKGVSRALPCWSGVVSMRRPFSLSSSRGWVHSPCTASLKALEESLIPVLSAP